MKKWTLEMSAALGPFLLSCSLCDAAPALSVDTARVLRTSGSVRFSTGKDPVHNLWNPVNAGSFIAPGSVVETGSDGMVELAIGSSELRPPPAALSPSYTLATRLTYEPSAGCNVIRLSENSSVALDKMTFLQTGADTISDAHLNLQK